MKILFDPKLKRPGCVLLQAAFGCGIDIAHRFPVESWLVNLTDDMRVYEITPAELEKAVEYVSAKVAQATSEEA